MYLYRTYATRKDHVHPHIHPSVHPYIHAHIHAYMHISGQIATHECVYSYTPAYMSTKLWVRPPSFVQQLVRSRWRYRSSYTRFYTHADALYSSICICVLFFLLLLISARIESPRGGVCRRRCFSPHSNLCRFFLCHGVYTHTAQFLPLWSFLRNVQVCFSLFSRMKEGKK